MSLARPERWEDIGSILELGNVKMETGQVLDAILRPRYILRIYDKFVGLKNVRSTFSRTSLARALAKQDEHSQVVVIQLDALKIVESVFKKNHVPAGRS